uniref:Uncharacterized protein n=1 Tax=Rhizophora mucronata TaxID=61149 RepID=A0A2P2P8Z2_RHIMU
MSCYVSEFMLKILHKQVRKGFFFFHHKQHIYQNSL